MCTRKCKKQRFVCCDYNDISMIYINSSMALLRLRNHNPKCMQKIFSKISLLSPKNRNQILISNWENGESPSPE